MNKPILHTQTGGISFLSFLLLAAGLAAILFQILILASTPPEGEAPISLSSFILGGLGLVFIVLFFLTARKGWLEVHPNGVKGKIAGGKSYEFTLEQIGEVVLTGRGVHFKDPTGKNIVLDKTPRDRQAPGLVWMLKTYPELKTSQLEGKGSHAKLPTALRLFFEDDQALFGDRGFIYTFNETKYFFPDTPTAPLPPEKGRGNNNDLSPYANQIAAIPRFEPDPAKLPLESILRSLKVDEEGLLQQLIEGHGGMELNELEPGRFEGNIPGWRAEVTSRLPDLEQ